MSARFVWQGLSDLMAQFATLAHDLTQTAAPDVASAAQQAKTTIAAGYPVRTGNLKNSLGVVLVTEDTRTKAVVINTSPHAGIFERGSQARHTALGANRGSMPPNPIFSATMIRTRRGLYTGPIVRVLQVFGLRVSGSA